MMSLLITACMALFLYNPLILAHPLSGRSGGVHVHAGQSIQAAVDDAQPGTHITVEAGVYAEQVTITKDGISLLGEGAVLVPPPEAIENICTGLAGNATGAGICVTGSGIELGPYVAEHRKVLSVSQPVRDVSISGFFVNGFDGENIAVVGGEGVQVTENSLYNGGQYGFLAAGSPNTTVNKNTVISENSLRFIAICNDNPSGAEVAHNHVSGYSTGLCVQTAGAIIESNNVVESCLGVFIDPGVDGAQVFHNDIGATHPDCVTASVVNAGIIIYGSTNSLVQGNVIKDQRAGGMAAAIIIVDALEVGPQFVASGNKIIDNILLDNDFDIFVNTTGTDNIFFHNQCTTPSEFCN